MLLTLDIGNSRIKGGLFEGTRLKQTFHLDHGDEADIRTMLQKHLGESNLTQAGMASVVPERTGLVSDAVYHLSGVGPVLIGPDMPLPLRLAYGTPATLGLDRLAAACGGWVLYGAPGDQGVVVVDAGTAVTYEVIDAHGLYAGGAIAPGPALLERALHTGTAQLPPVPLEVPEEVVGRSTREALQSGILYGFIDAVAGMLQRIEARLGGKPLVVATGGWAGLLGGEVRRIDTVDPHLVLQGIRILVENPASGTADE